ncbi:MAG TPA: hypothetical protein VF395_07910, partial [Polyangiaceae bacterium]
MASTPTTIWTVLPNGFDTGGIPLFSLYVSLRFDDPVGARLSDYTAGNWPRQIAAFLAQQALVIQLGTAANSTDVPVTFDASLLSEALWDALFPPSTPVRPYEFQDHSLRPIRSFGVRAIHEYIETVYTSVANASAAEFPDIAATNDAATLVGVVSDAMAVVERLARAGQGKRGFIPALPPRSSSKEAGPHPDATIEAQLTAIAASAGGAVPAAEFFRAYRFYNRGQQEEYQSQLGPRAVASIPPPVIAPRFDVHEVLAALGDHPAILRRLGIVLDGRFLRNPLGGNIQFDRIRAALRSATGLPVPGVQTPWTRFDATTFLPAPVAGSDLSGGFLSLGNSKAYDVVQADVDGSALRTIDFAMNMGRVLARRPAQPKDQCLPGVGALEPAPEPQSLPALRSAGFTVTRKDRDGAVFAQLVNSAANNGAPGSAVLTGDDVLRGYRVDVSYHGKWFSLCARVPTYTVPGATITPPPPPDEGYVKAVSASSTSKDPPSPAKDLYLHEALFGWHNWSLVVPRPGRTASFDRNDVDRTQQEVVRRETNPSNADYPIQIATTVAPKSLPPLRFGERYAFRARAVDLAGNSLPLSATPPAIAVSASQIFQRYEPVAAPALVLRTPVTAGESAERLVIRTKVTSDPLPDESSIFNAVNERHVAPPKTSQLMAELHGAFDPYFSDPAKAYTIAAREQGTWQDPGGDVKLIDATGATVDPAPLAKRGEPLPGGHYVIHTSDQPALPYLADPLAFGVAFHVPGKISKKGYPVGGTGWPDVSTFRLVLKSAAGASPTFDVSDLVEIGLPKGTILTVRYSSVIDGKNLALMARFNAMSAAGRAAMDEIGGQHWMLTPYREITFVHAVEKPLDVPVVKEPVGVGRTLGDTFAELRSQVSHHSHSTGRLDLRAAWSEMVDRLQNAAAGPEGRSGHVYARDVGYEETPAQLPGPCEAVRHEFGDTKHRWVKYHVVATTRYREYFPTLSADPENLTVEGPETALVNIPNSARPPLPQLLYVIPTFQWTSSADDKTSTRTGRGLRIYVDRPWFLSGDDELLGVILPPGSDAPAELRKYVSEWGSDPLFDSAGPATDLVPESFVYDAGDPTAVPTVATGLSLVEADPSREDLLVTAVGFKPQYNAERKLWYFDIVLDPGTSYTPFVRLSLARFQPYSLDGAHLSRTVRAEFAQLVADRVATLAYQDASVDVVVSGVVGKSVVKAKGKPSAARTTAVGSAMGLPRGFVSSPESGRGRLVRAHVESRADRARGDLGWTAVGGPVVLAPSTMALTASTVYFRGNVPLPT